MKPNRMKEKLARGEPALGCSVMFPSAADRRDAGLRRLRLGADRLRARQHRLGGRGADGDGVRRRRHHAYRAAEDQFGERHPERYGPRRDGRAGAACRHRRGRAPSGGVGQVRTGRHARAWRPARVRTAGASARACPTSLGRPTRSRSCAFSSSTRRPCATSMRSSPSTASTCSSSAHRTCRSRWASRQSQGAARRQGDRGGIGTHRRRRPHAWHAGNARHTCRGAGPGVPLHLHAPAAPARHRRLGIPEAIALAPAFTLCTTLAYVSPRVYPATLTRHPAAHSNARTARPWRGRQEQEDPWRRRQGALVAIEPRRPYPVFRPARPIERDRVSPDNQEIKRAQGLRDAAFAREAQ